MERRFDSLAHELRHLILGVPTVVGETFEDMLRSNSREELRVNNLASELLIPAGVVNSSSSDLPIVAAALKKLAKLANVSELAAAVRVCNLARAIGLVNASVVLLDRARIRWQWSNTLIGNPEIATRLLAEARTEAPDAFRHRKTDGDVIVASTIENPFFRMVRLAGGAVGSMTLAAAHGKISCHLRTSSLIARRHRLTNRTYRQVRGVLSIGLGLGLLSLIVSTKVLASCSQPRVFVVRDLGAVPRSAHQRVLLKNDAIQKELKITEAQTAKQATIERGYAQEFVKAKQRQAPASREFRIAFNKREDAEILETLTLQQRARLDQIQLQAQGPLAFTTGGNDTTGMVEPPLAERLDLTEDQSRRAGDIFQESAKQIEMAASFPIVLASGNERPTPEVIRSFVESPQFQAAKDKAGRAGRDASAAVVRRIEEILNNEQRVAYRRLLGEPFDFSKLRIGAAGANAAKFDRMLVADLLGLDEGTPRVDPSFNAK